MQLSDLHPSKGSKRKRKRVGRGAGSGMGKTCTRGENGQKSRSGASFYLGFEGGKMPLFRKMPKRGFINPNTKRYTVFNLQDLNLVPGEGPIDLEVLQASGRIKKGTLVKILGTGKLEKSRSVSAHAFSASARKAIESVGGEVHLISENEKNQAEGSKKDRA